MPAKYEKTRKKSHPSLATCSAVEVIGEPGAVDVEGFENIEDVAHREVPIVGPEDDVQVLLARLEAVDDTVQQQLPASKIGPQLAEIGAIQLDPEGGSLQVLQPFGAQVTLPLDAYPVADSRFALVVAGVQALDPLVAINFNPALGPNAQTYHGRSLRVCGCVGEYHNDVPRAIQD